MSIITGNIDGNGYVTQADNDIVVVPSNIIIAAPIGITVNNKGVHILNQGTVVSYADAIQLDFISSDGTGTFVENAASGLLSANNGVNSNAGGNRVINHGTIDANNLGIYLNGDGNYVLNDGTIDAAVFGIGIVVDGLLPTVINDGVVHGGQAGISISASAGLSGYIFNSGTVDGVTYAVTVSGEGSTLFRNTGTVHGDIASDATGSFTYDGRGGSVDGVITGGSGADTIIAGSDGETVNGGKGHDKLYAGAGADTFAFTSYSSPDYDHVSHFDVAKDTIQLDHTVFTRLVAETTPVFSIASAPTSASDLLYYNSSTGGLYYDPDGSGTKYHGYAVANLDKGLALAAKDFSVV